MSALAVTDLSVIEGDARVSDRRLMEVLGYDKIGNLHQVIRRHWDELADFGEVFLNVQKNP